MAIRYQTERLDASRVQRTPQGFVRVDAAVCQPGVYTYYENGRAIREYLPAEEIARADSLATLEDATVTDRHPPNMVDPKSWGSVSIGHARNGRTEASGAALATLVINRADAIDRVGADLREVSRGVKVRIDNTPGVTPDGKPYDRVQRDIVYNHIALGPSNWGRQGNQVSLRLDSAGDEITPDTESQDNMAFKFAYDGKEFNTEAELTHYLNGLKTRADAGFPPPKDNEEDKKAKAEQEKKDAQAKADKERADKAEAELAKIRADAAKAARAALETEAKVVLGADHKFDSAETDRGIHAAVIAKLNPAIKLDGLSDDAVRGAYVVALATRADAVDPSRQDSNSMVLGLRGATSEGKPRTDEQQKPRKTPAQKAREAWKQDCSLSRK